ncbi:MAG: hypothetical protein J2P37_23895, partial [Ktedonobacteraceae bacterium]|nr:hypothetical protein [Ktedonobacteraceae bacterium]
MVEEPRTWREQLKRIISNASERQRIADAIGINPATLVRWAKGTIKPRLDSLLQLLENVPPHYTFSLSKLIVEEYPQYTSAIETRIRKAAPAIPSAFYTRVLNTYTSSHPYLRDGVLRTMILQQVLAHLAPMQQDLIISLAQCMPPVGGERWVRSLRLVAGRSTRYWQRFMENRVLFMGAESPVGQAVRTGRQHSKPDQHELEWIYSCYDVSSPGSFVATPILRDQRSAGCLYLFSPEMDFFRPDHLQLIQSYT